MPDREEGRLTSRYSKLCHFRQIGIDSYPQGFVKTYGNNAGTAMFEAGGSDYPTWTRGRFILIPDAIMGCRRLIPVPSPSLRGVAAGPREGRAPN